MDSGLQESPHQLAHPSTRKGPEDPWGSVEDSKPSAPPDYPGRPAGDSGRLPSTAKVTLGYLSLFVLFAGNLAIVLSALASKGKTFLLPFNSLQPDWLVGPLAMFDIGGVTGIDKPLAIGEFTVLIIGMVVGWVALVLVADLLPGNVVVGSGLALIGLMTIAPPLLSNDIFSYIGYARLGALHEINPYQHGVSAIPFDAVFPYTGSKWHNTPSMYGPVFTLFSYLLVPLGITGMLWTLKALTGIAAATAFLLIYKTAPKLGRPAASTACFAILSPPILTYAIAGAHNDILMATLTITAITTLTTHKTKTSAITQTLAATTKITTILTTPFLLLTTKQPKKYLLTTLTTTTIITLTALLTYGPKSINPLATTHKNFNHYLSFFGQIEQRIGRFSPQTIEVLTHFSTYASVALLLILVALVYFRRINWITGATLATCGVVFLALKVEPWYACWFLPLAAFSKNRLIRWGSAGLAFGLLLMWIQLWTMLD